MFKMFFLKLSPRIATRTVPPPMDAEEIILVNEGSHQRAAAGTTVNTFQDPKMHQNERNGDWQACNSATQLAVSQNQFRCIHEGSGGDQHTA